jgi:hypothetical protein
MLLPAAGWGTLFTLVPFAYVSSQQYQIVANTTGTIVNVTDGQQFQLNIGDYRLITVAASAMLTSNYPIQLVQMGQVLYHVSVPYIFAV